MYLLLSNKFRANYSPKHLTKWAIYDTITKKLSSEDACIGRYERRLHENLAVSILQSVQVIDFSSEEGMLSGEGE